MATKRPKAAKNGSQQDSPVDPDLVGAALTAASMVIVAKKFDVNAVPIVYRIYRTGQFGAPVWQASWHFGQDCPEVDAVTESAITIIGEEIGLGFCDTISLTEIIKRLEARSDLMLDATKDLMTLIVAVMEDAEIVAHYARDLIAQATGRDYDLVIGVFPMVAFKP